MQEAEGTLLLGYPHETRLESMALARRSTDGLWRKMLADYDAASRSEEFVREQIDGVDRFAGLKDRARVLDIGCGGGAQTLEIARRGCRVLGLDPDSAALARARALSQDKGLWVHFQSCDLRRIPYDGEFNLAVNLHTPLGNLPREVDDLRCLQSVQKALKPEGKLLLDLPNRDWLVRNLDPGTLSQKVFDLETGLLSQGERSVRVYSLTELARLLGLAGFAMKGAWGGYDGAPFTLSSLRMIVLAQKIPAGKAPRRLDGLPRAIRIKGRG